MNMKAKNLYILLLCAVLLPFFNSCIDEGDNKFEVSDGGVGVIAYYSGKKMLRTAAGALWYSPEMDIWPESEGTPMLVYFSADLYNQPSTAYWTIQILSKADINKEYVEERTTLNDDFIFPMSFDSQKVDSVDIVNNVWLIYPEIKYQTGQEMSYELIYLPEETVGNLYTFYLKAKVTKEGSGSNKEGYGVAAFEMGDFIYAKGEDTNELRYNLVYVSGVDGEGNAKYTTLFEDKLLWKRK
jgi:hypothetical protein